MPAYVESIDNTNVINAPPNDTDPSNQNAPSQEYIDSMTAKADSGLSMGSDNPNKEEKLLAGKYKTEEDLNKGVMEILTKQHGNLEDAYLDLQKGLGNNDKSSVDDSGGSGENQTPEDGTTIPDGQSNKTNTELADQGSENTGTLDFDNFSKEFVKDGKLSDDSYKELEDAGYKSDLVDQYLSGQVALANATALSLYNLAGGQDNYAKVMTWGKENLSESQVADYDTAIKTNDPAKMSAALNSVMVEFSKSNSLPPQNRISPGSASGAPNTSTQGYNSRAEMQADMNNPQYQKDPAFREQVMNKIKFSNIFG